MIDLIERNNIKDRAVVRAADVAEWQPVAAHDIPGLYVTMAIEGAAAGSLRMACYLFESGGSFTAALLVDTAEGPRFVATAGTWQFADGQLRLDDAEPADVRGAGDMLRLEGAEGRVVLRREAML